MRSLNQLTVELLAHAHLALFSGDGHHLLPAIECLLKAGRTDLLPNTLRIAKSYGEARVVHQLREIGQTLDIDELLSPDFATWFQTWGLPRFECYHDAEKNVSYIHDKEATFLRRVIAEEFADTEKFWHEALAQLRQDAAYPRERLLLLEQLSRGEELVVEHTETCPQNDDRFRAYCEEHQLRILRQFQVGRTGTETRTSVFLVLDRDDRVKVFKELLPAGFERYSLEGDDEPTIYTHLGNIVNGIPQAYGTLDIGNGLRYLRISVCYGQLLADVTKKENLLSQDDACTIIHRLALTLADLHHHNILYLDLRPENVKFDGRDIHLLDLGDARRIGTDGKVTTHVHDARYAPPEVSLLSEAGTASDVFQLGIIFHELLFGEHPFVQAWMDHCAESESSHRLRYTLSNAIAPLAERSTLHDPRYTILHRMLSRDPASRPSAKEVANTLGAHLTHKPITHRRRSAPRETNGTVLFPARMGIPHRGHIDFMARIMELGYQLTVSIQQSYITTYDDPLPKWLVLKIVARALKEKGFDPNDVRFLCTPFYETPEQHLLHFGMLPDTENIVAVASGNPSVHDMFSTRYPIIDQHMVFATEDEVYETRSWGTHLRTAIRANDRGTFDKLIAPGTEEILSFDELRAYCNAPTLEFVWGHPDWGRVFVTLLDADGGTVFKRRVGAYSTPEDTIVANLTDATFVDRTTRDSLINTGGQMRLLRYKEAHLDDKRNECITYRIITP